MRLLDWLFPPFTVPSHGEGKLLVELTEGEARAVVSCCQSNSDCRILVAGLRYRLGMKPK